MKIIRLLLLIALLFLSGKGVAQDCVIKGNGHHFHFSSKGKMTKIGNENTIVIVRYAYVVKEIKRRTQRKFTPEEKIIIVLEVMRGEETVAVICRKYDIHTNNYFKWSKLFIFS